MSALRNMESAISGLVNRVFGRMFRGHVELVELARKLGREMEDHKAVSVARIYVPNEYVVYLSSSDRSHYSSFERSATRELADYLTQRARHDGFTLLSAPVVTFETDSDLRNGEYGIACRVVDPPEPTPEELAGAVPTVPPEQNVPFTPYEPPVDLLVGDDPDEDGDVIIGDAMPAAIADNDDADDDGPAPLAAVPDLPDEDAADDAVVQDDVPETDPESADAAPAVADDSDEDESADADVAPEPVARVDEEADEAGAADDPVIDAPPPPSSTDDEGRRNGDGPSEPAIAVPPIPPAEAPRKPVIPPPSFGPRAPDPVVTPFRKTPPSPPPAPPQPIAPDHTNDGLAGVSGTQMMPPAPPAEDEVIQEEVSLIIDGRRNRLSKRTTTLGRSRDCDVSVSDANASRHHAEIRHIGLDYFLVDLGSTNGTYVNGQRVRRHAIADGDRIVIGTTEMIVEHIKTGRR